MTAIAAKLISAMGGWLTFSSLESGQRNYRLTLATHWQVFDLIFADHLQQWHQ